MNYILRSCHQRLGLVIDIGREKSVRDSVSNTFTKILTVGTIVVLGVACASHAEIIPQRVNSGALLRGVYSVTGLVETEVQSRFFRGSGAVARDPRLFFSCAHTAFGNGTWASSIGVRVGWNAASDTSAYTRLRGYRFLSGYAESAVKDEDSAESYAVDFIVGFHNFRLAPAAAPAREQGAEFLKNASVQKMILGYPETLDFNGVEGGFFMHQTGPFPGAFNNELGAYFGLDGVSTGSGNSGGPVFENSTGNWRLAAILVSGTKDSIGVYAINSAGWQASTNALEALRPAPSPRPRPTPSPSPVVSPIPPPTSLKELKAQRDLLLTQLRQAQLIKNPNARIIQVRRILTMLQPLTIQIFRLR